MSNIFENIKAFIIPVKLSDYELSLYKRLLTKNGGSVGQNQKESNYIFTALKSSSRISRNIENLQAPILNIKWVKDCDKQQKILPTNDYRIETDSKVLNPIAIASLQRSERTSDQSILHKRFANSPPEKLQFVYDEDEAKITPALDSKGNELDLSLAPGFINTKYECFRPTPYEPLHNKKLVSLLLLLERKRMLDNEDKRSLSYRHAISAIKAYPRDIRSSKEAAKIIGVGQKMAEKIRVFLQTGTIDEAEELRTDEHFRTMSLFNKVWGVGVTTAKIWWDMGYRTLQEVLDNAKLTATVKLGIQLFPDFNEPMSRADVEEIIDIIKKELHYVDEKSYAIPVGGYRRGKENNGDLDIILSSRSGSVSCLLDRLIDSLMGKDYLKYKLWHSTEVKAYRKPAIPSKKPGAHQTFDSFEKCFCAFLQPSKNKLRQVDLICVRPQQVVTAVLGWTGSRQFERSLRDYAKKEKSMNVSSEYIHLEEKDGSMKKISVSSEEEAFKVIGIPYLDPEMRNC